MALHHVHVDSDILKLSILSGNAVACGSHLHLRNDGNVQVAPHLEGSLELQLLLPLDSTSQETVFLRLAISILLATRCYKEAIRVCEQLIKGEH